MKNSKGFTLIELLVVIAVIGVLSSIVLASLSIARQRGRDGAIKANLNTVRSEMELYYVGGESYGDPAVAGSAVCDVETDPEQPFTSVDNIRHAIASAELSSDGQAVCSVGVGGGSWAVSVPLADSADSWCVRDIGAGGTGVASEGGPNSASCQ